MLAKPSAVAMPVSSTIPLAIIRPGTTSLVGIAPTRLARVRLQAGGAASTFYHQPWTLSPLAVGEANSNDMERGRT